MGDAVTYECFIEFIAGGHRGFIKLYGILVIVCEQETDNDEDLSAVVSQAT